MSTSAEQLPAPARAAAERDLAEILRLHKAFLRAKKIGDAWSALARARGEILADQARIADTKGAERRAVRAVAQLERLGVNPKTGRPLAKPKKKPAKKGRA